MLLQVWECVKSAPRLSIAIGAFLLIASLIAPARAFFAHLASLYSTDRQLRHLQPQGISRSNLRDQFDSKYATPEGASAQEPVRVKALYIHPVKSCGGVEVSRALLTKSGFLFDRCFAIVAETPDPNNTSALEWRFLSQRTKPQMCLIEENLWLPGPDSDKHDELVRSGGCVVLKFDDPDVQGWPIRLATILYALDLSAVPKVTLILPLKIDLSAKLKNFRIHGREASGCDMGELPSIAPALPKLREYLGVPERRGFTLMRCTSDTLVRTDKNLAPLQHIGTPSVHGYTDQQPVNINSLSSVHAVSRLMPPENQPLDARRFRANIWISGAPAYDEESWLRCRILSQGAMAGEKRGLAPSLSVVCRTSRCTMPNVNLTTGTFDTDNPPLQKKKGRSQPSSTLVEYRTVEEGNKSALGYLGMHCVPEDSCLDEATRSEVGLYVNVGDEIQVLERGTHLYGSTADAY